MRIILQNRESAFYFKSVSEWTADADRALDFKNLIYAVDFVRMARLTNLDIVLYFGDERYNLRLPASPTELSSPVVGAGC
jgi:hypothetical protein